MALQDPEPAFLSPLALAVEQVRHEIARDLHDGTIQTLTAILLHLEYLGQQAITERDVARGIDAIEDELRGAVIALRQVVQGLREDRDLEEDFVNVVAFRLIQPLRRQTAIDASVSAGPGWPRHLPSAVAHNVFQIVHEALANVWRHSAASRVQVRFDLASEDVARVRVTDDGLGLHGFTNKIGRGAGIEGMRERAAVLGGHLHVRRRRPQGTIVEAHFPLAWLRGD